LLYAGSSDTSQPLLPVLETPEDEKHPPFAADALAEGEREGDVTDGKGGNSGKEQDKLLMPPPKMVSSLPRPTSARYVFASEIRISCSVMNAK
jgi:hypothetical protein